MNCHILAKTVLSLLEDQCTSSVQRREDGIKINDQLDSHKKIPNVSCIMDDDGMFYKTITWNYPKHNSLFPHQ